MATKTILSTTETRATFAVSGDFTPGSVDFDLDVDRRFFQRILCHGITLTKQAYFLRTYFEFIYD